MRHSYVVPMRWMVIYEYEVPGGALNLNSTNYPDHGHHGDSSPSGKKFPMVEPKIFFIVRYQIHDVVIDTITYYTLSIHTASYINERRPQVPCAIASSSLLQCPSSGRINIPPHSPF